MIYKTVNLKDEFPCLKQDVSLTAFCPENSKEISPNRKRKTILIIPGGAYVFLSERETDPIALRLVGFDVNAFVLNYNLGPYESPYPFLEGLAAIAYIRNHAQEYHVDPDHLGVMGFSAGGNFAATLGFLQNQKDWADLLNVPLAKIRINGILLGYPVIDLDDAGLTGEMLLKNQPEKKKDFEILPHVDSSYPPTFLFALNDDQVVDSMHSLKMAMALKKAGVRFEFHYYPVGYHGVSLADHSVYADEGEEPAYKPYLAYVENWFSHALRFIREIL